jgi:hypothetical protein
MPHRQSYCQDVNCPGLAAHHPISSEQLIAAAKKQHWAAYPAKGTLIDEIVYVQTAEVPAPGDR